jgi:hypothetical protein
MQQTELLTEKNHLTLSTDVSRQKVHKSISKRVNHAVKSAIIVSEHISFNTVNHAVKINMLLF